MDAAGRDVRRDQRGDLALLELLQDPVALRLRLPAVQGRGEHAVGEQVLGQAVGRALGVHEHDHATVAGRDLQRHVALVAVVHVEHVVLHAGDRAGARVDGVGDRVAQEAADQAVHVLVEGRGEQQSLPVRTDLLQQRGDLRQEAHVGHLVGLVEHGDLDAVETDVAAVQQVPQATGRGDEHVDAALHLAGLAADGQAADNGGDAQVDGGRVGGERGVHLLGQLAGRHQDHRQRRLGVGAASGRAGQQCETEREGLAGARAAAAEDVTSDQRVGQGGGLDRERLGDALAHQRRLQGARQLHVLEGRDRRQTRRLRRRHLELALRGEDLTLRRTALRRPVGGAGRGAATALAAALLPGALLRGEGTSEARRRTLIVGPIGAVVHDGPSTGSHKKKPQKSPVGPAFWPGPQSRSSGDRI